MSFNDSPGLPFLLQLVMICTVNAGVKINADSEGKGSRSIKEIMIDSVNVLLCSRSRVCTDFLTLT